MSATTTWKTILILAISLNLQSFFAQDVQGKVWVTVDDLSILPKANSKGELTSSSTSFQKIVNQFDITGVKLAFPASKSRELQKVYEIECNCNQAVLSAALDKPIPGLSNPEEVPSIELLYEPNDYNAYYTPDYALDLINAKGAWDLSTGDTNIIVGVSDANFDVNHTELVGKLMYVEPGMSNPNINHGTAVAITVAGNSDNGFGKSSIGFNTRLRLYTMGYNQILQACYDGVKVINMSWASGCSYNDYCQSVIDEIYNNGVILVASAGNGGTCGGPTNLVYPSAYNHVISVTSIGFDDSHEKFNPSTGVYTTHQHNATVDISAPGYIVPLCIAGNNFSYMNGTSFASPFVSGTIALMLDVNPCLNAEDVEYILKQSSTNIDAINPNYVGIIGAGRLNAAAAVAMAKNYAKLAFTSQQLDFLCETQTGTASLSVVGGVGPYTYTWENGDTDSTSSNLPIGTHIVSVTDAQGCIGDTTVEITSLGTPTVNFDYTTNILVDSPSFALNDTNGDGIIKVKGNITIASGVNYTMETKHLEFGYGTDGFAGINVNSNAVLSITKNSTLKGISACKSNWDGIVISDNINTSTGSVVYDAAPGKLIMDKANVYDAVVAIKTKDVDAGSITPAFQYGSVELSNSVFTNNATGLKLTSKDDSSNTNSVINTIFLLEDSTINNPVHIELNDVDNLAVLKNSFFGNDKVINEYRGTAIKATNSSLYVAKELNADLLNMPVDGNDFYNLSSGIEFINTDDVAREIIITGSYFTKVNESINIDKYATGMIYQNEIDVPQGTEENRTFGITIGSNSTMVVTDNTFTTSNSMPVGVYGVILNDSDSNKMDVYRNDFEGNFTVANLFEGNNLKTFVDCNSYSGTNDYHWFVKAGKLGDQTGVDVNGQSLIYKNQFTTCQNGNPQIFINGDATGFVYQSKAVYMPTSTTPGVIENIITKNAEDNQCRNFFDNTIPTPTIDEVEFGTGTLVFPNPTTNSSSVNWNEVDIDQIAIFNANGELLRNAVVTGNKGSFEINNLSSGMYFVKLSFEDVIFKTEKLVVSR